MMSQAEELLRSGLSNLGVEFRTTETVADVMPALTLPQSFIVVFITDCEGFHCPKDNKSRKTAPMLRKIKDFDKARDQEGWLVLRFWEHEIRGSSSEAISFVAKVHRAMQKALGFEEEPNSSAG